MSLRRDSLLLLLITGFTPVVAQTLTGPSGSSTVAFWYLGKNGQNGSGTNIASCCNGLSNLYYSSSKLYLPSTYTNPSFSASASGAWTVDTSTRTNEAGGMVSYVIKVQNAPTAGWENVSFTDGGHTSNTVAVYINAPNSLTSDAIQQWTACSTLVGGAYSGWTEVIYNSVYDRLSYQLTPIDVYEKLENLTAVYGGNNWPASYQEAIWPASLTGYDGYWSASTNKFPDHYTACTTAGGRTPMPQAYQTVSPQVGVQSFTQKFFVSTTDLNFDGVCVIRQATTFYTDRGTNSSVSSPPSSGYCNQGSYAN